MNVMYDAIHQRKQVLYTRSHTTGFTIVELLIVIVIIAILAAITIVAYNGIQNRAYNSAVQTDLETTYKKLLMYRGEYDTFPLASDTTSLKTILVASKGAYLTNGTTNSYIYCRSDTDAAVVGRSKSTTGYYVGSQGSGMIASGSWSNLNAVLCPLAGIPTTASGYSQLWFHANAQWAW